jgi:hypothetical protein
MGANALLETFSNGVYLILEAFLFKAVLYPRQQKATAFGRG